VSLGRVRASGVGICKKVMRGTIPAGEATIEGGKINVTTHVIQGFTVKGSGINREIGIRDTTRTGDSGVGRAQLLLLHKVTGQR
jgi:hypothetical protein